MFLRKSRKLFVWLLLVLLLGVACNNATPENTGNAELENANTAVSPTSQEMVRSVANVDTAVITVKGSTPVEVLVTVTGTLPDSCSQLAGTEQVMDGETVLFRVFVERPADMLCTQELAPFEATFPLDAKGLGIGTHTVNVNGVFAEFTLSETAVSPDDPALTCPAASEDMTPYLSEADGFCLLHPIGFEIENPADGTTVIRAPQFAEGEVTAVLTIENKGKANGRSVEELAAELLPADAAQTTMTLDGETAVYADQLPGDLISRQLVVIHNDTIYVLTMSPFDEENYPDATLDAELFWDTAVPSLTFTR